MPEPPLFNIYRAYEPRGYDRSAKIISVTCKAPKSGWILLFFTVCSAYADQVTLKNGDRITGAIVKKEGNDLTLKSDLIGTVTIPWDQISEIKSTGPLN